MPPRLNPHGHNGVCNLYCQEGETHALLVLAEHHCTDGTLTTGRLICQSAGRYYATLGWHLRHAKPVEADRATLLADLWARYPDTGPAFLAPGATADVAPPPSLNTEAYEPWLLTVTPLHGRRWQE